MLASLGPGWEEKREFNVKGMGCRVKQQTPQIVASFPQARHLAHRMQHPARDWVDYCGGGENRESISSLAPSRVRCKRESGALVR